MQYIQCTCQPVRSDALDMKHTLQYLTLWWVEDAGCGQFWSHSNLTAQWLFASLLHKPGHMLLENVAGMIL